MASRDCTGCRYFARDIVFELCMHDSSRYKVAEKAEHHTIGHMRSREDMCGEIGKLYVPISSVPVV